jgi:hypothetical protein
VRRPLTPICSTLGRRSGQGNGDDRNVEKRGVAALRRDRRAGGSIPRSSAEGDWPYLWLDATYVKVRKGGRIVSVAVIIAVAVNAQGRREVLGITVMPSGAEAFWTDFLRSLTRRGLRGVKLVISDAHEGLKAAAAKVLGASWQRCRVHFMRNALACVAKRNRAMVAAALRNAFDQPNREAAAETLVQAALNSSILTNGGCSPWMHQVALSDKTARLHPRHVVPKPAQKYEPKVPVKVREWIGPALSSPNLVLKRNHRRNRTAV